MKKIYCFHKEHTAIQICTLIHHMGIHLSHSFTMSNQSFSIKGQQVSCSSVLENFFLPADGKCMTEIHIRVYPFSKLCGDLAVDAFHGWIRYARRYFPRCLARENIACDVDEVLWPDRNKRGCSIGFFFFFLCIQ